MRLPDKLLMQWHGLSVGIKIAIFILVGAFLFANIGVIVLAALFGGAAVLWVLPHAQRLHANWNNKIIAEKFVSRNIVFTYQTNSDKHSKIDLLVTRIWTAKDGELMVSGFYHHRDMNLRFRAERMSEVEDIDSKSIYESGLSWAAAIIESDRV